MLGDINCNYLKPADHVNVKDIFRLYGYDQLIKNATRITSSTNTLIDVIFSTHPVNILKTFVISADLSDHELIGCVRKLNNVKLPPKTVTCRNYKSYNVVEVQEDLQALNWPLVFTASCPFKAWSQMKVYLLEIINKHAPVIKKRVKGRSCKWLNTDVKIHI